MDNPSSGGCSSVSQGEITEPCYKAASRSAFSINVKYARISDLLLAYVWHLADGEPYDIFAMTYVEAVGVGDAMGYTATPSWESGAYSTSRPSRRLRELLEPYRMNADAWRRRIDDESETRRH